MPFSEVRKRLRNFEIRLAIVYAIALIGLCLLSLLSNELLKNQAAKQAASFITRSAKVGDLREVILSLNQAKLDYFSAVAYYDESGRKQFSLPANLDPDVLKDSSLIDALLNSRVSIGLFTDDQETNKIGNVLFVFGRFAHVPYAVGIWFFFLLGIVPLLRHEEQKIKQDQARELLLREESSRADLARRVRHDIRSPLGALQIAARDLRALPQSDQELIQASIRRIREIISELELVNVAAPLKRVSYPQQKTSQSVLDLTQEIIREKRAHYKEDYVFTPSFSEDSFLCYADVEASEFKRALSNIIDNAVEASTYGSEVRIELSKTDNLVKVVVSDSGKGMTEAEILCASEKGYTTKQQGSGLGLYYAKEKLAESGGQILITSRISKGTRVTLELPCQEAPAHFLQTLQIPSGCTIVVVDDQDSTHQSLKRRFEEFRNTTGSEFNVKSFKNARDFLNWYDGPRTGSFLFLFDYDLGPGQPTGLDLYTFIKQSEKVVLVTGHFDQEQIQNACKTYGIKILPKPFTSRVKLEIVT